MTRTESSSGRRRAPLRRGRAALLAVLAALGLVAALPVGPVPAPAAAAPTDAPRPASPQAAPRPVPPAKKVTITPTGFVPPDVAVVAGQTVEFSNASGAEQTVDDAGTLFDSGPIPDGGGFAVTLPVPGFNEYDSAAHPDWRGSITVGQLELPGPPDALVNDNLPELPVPEATDLDEMPDTGIGASRTRLMVMFRDGTTVAQANAALAAADVAVMGAVPELRMVLVAVDDPGAGQFDPVLAAEATLRADPVVKAAVLDLERELDAVPALAETDRTQGANDDPKNWTWIDTRRVSNGSGVGTGGNYGLESSRFPAAWNLLDDLRKKNNIIDTLVIDTELARHKDLPQSVKPVCIGSRCNQDGVAGQRYSAHGTHVSGTIGAAYNNPMDGQPGRARGVDGGNPVAYLYGTPLGALRGNIFPGDPPPSSLQRKGWSSAPINQTYALALLGKEGNLWPNLRVVNLSLGTVSLKLDAQGLPKWGALVANKRCGPGSDDDGPGATGPCTMSSWDPLRKEIEGLALFAQELARLARERNVTLVVSAGNESDKICVKASGGVGQPHFETVNGKSVVACNAGDSFAKEDARVVVDMGRASAVLGPGDDNPYVLVEAVKADQARAPFSNVDGDVSAPGFDVLSLAEKDGYRVLSGTSMAAPHVTALVGYLLASKPNLSYSELRGVLREFGWDDVTDGGAPRIDAFDAVLAADPQAARALVDVNDSSADGDRRIIRTRGGDAPDTQLGPTASRGQLSSDPDGRIDMRDFRRFRDAFLEACATAPPGESPSPSACPAAGQIRLDGTADHPKKDLNLDGCVNGQSPTCVQPEFRFSRFDFNGDGKLNLDDLAPVAVVPDPSGFGTRPASSRAQKGQFTDLDLLEAWWDRDLSRTEGYRASDLRGLLSSGDVEVHADALFQAGAQRVEVTVNYGDRAALEAPTQQIDRRDGSVVVTAPADGSPVAVTGVGYKADGTRLDAYPEATFLYPGDDHRVDLCVPTLSAVPGTTRPYTNAGRVPVSVVVRNCGRPVAAAVPLTGTVAPRPGSPAPATTVTPTATTDATGRATMQLDVAPRAEQFDLVVKAQVDLDPTKPGPEEVTGIVPVEVTEAPRLVYRWEQVTDRWSMREHGVSTAPDGSALPYDTDYGPPSADPLVLERSGSVTPVPETDGGRADARIVEDVGPNTLPYRARTQRADGSNATVDEAWSIPATQRHRDELSSQQVTDYYVDDGLIGNTVTYGNTYVDVDDDEVTVHNLADVGGAGYRYSTIASCDVFCRSLWDLDQVSLSERERGSSLAWGEDLGAPLTFRRDDAGRFGSYTWCSQPRDFEMRRVKVGEFTYTGTAHSRFRFTATVTTDPTVTPDSLSFPADCEAPAPPTAAIARDFVTAKEGDLVKFVDASSDPNGDIVSRSWDFGDGTSSTEQFPRHRYADDGSYLVRLTVTDSKGATSAAELPIEVTNVAPEVSADPVSVKDGDPVLVSLRLFDAGERDQEALKLHLSWEGGGATYADVVTKGGAATLDLGPQPPGQRRLVIDVSDKDQARTTAVVQVDVGAAPAPNEPPPQIETAPAPGCVYGVRLDVDEQDLLDLLDGYRTTNGRRQLYASPTLTAAAESQARWLRDNDRFQHEGDGGSSPGDRARAAGYPGTAVGENLARGPAGAPGALVIWKISDPHDANQLDPRWRAAGIARVDTVHGGLWVIVFGDRLDCPTDPPDFDGAVIDPVIDPVGRPGTEVLASGGDGAPSPVSGPTPGVIHVERLPEPSPAGAPVAGTSPVGPAPAGSAPASDPPAPAVAAFTISSVAPATGSPVLVTNRSTGAIVLDPGNGAQATDLTLGGTTTRTYLEPGLVTVRGVLGGLVVTHHLDVGGLSLPPSVSYTGPTAGAQGARVDLRATVTAAGGARVAGRSVDFSIEGRHLTATTDDTGVATVSWVIDVPAGPHTLRVEAPATATGPGAGVDVAFMVAANTPPVVNAHGPYDLIVGQPLSLDLSGSYDPDGLPLGATTWDLDDDGQFDDAAGSTVVPAATVTQVVCGGTCTPGVDETIRVRVLDAVGGETVVTTTVRFRRDFSLGVDPPSALVNPGGNIGFSVAVSTTSGFDQPVTLSVPDLPAGLTATFEPPAVVPGQTSLLALRAASDAGQFNGPFTVRGTSGTIVHDATGTVDVEFGLLPVCTVDASVRVVDDATGAPLADALVNGTYVTDADGRVRITGLGLGPQNAPVRQPFNVVRSGYNPAFVNPQSACGRDVVVEIRMSRIVVGTFRGRLVEGIPDPDDHSENRAVIPTDRPVGVGSVLIGPDPRNFTSRTPTAADSSFSVVTPAGAGRATQYEASGYWSESGRVDVPAGGTVEVVQPLVKACTGQLDVRVLDNSTRRPLENATVISSGQVLTTDRSGRVRVTDVALGRRNSSREVPVSARVNLNGKALFANASATVSDCGSIGVVDLAFEPPEIHMVTVKGRVTNKLTGAPVAGAIVYPGGVTLSLITDADGYYASPSFVYGVGDPASVFTNVTAVPPPDQAANWVNVPVSKPVTYTPGATLTVDLQLTPQLYSSVDIQVVDADSGEPVAGADVRGVGTADTQGRVRVEGIRTNVPMAYAGFATAPGYIDGVAQTTLVPGGNVTLTIPLARLCAPATIRGSVRNASTGAPLEGALVTGPPNVTTGPDGRFLMYPVKVGLRTPVPTTLTASKEGFFSASRNITLFCGANLTIDMNAPNTGSGSLSGRITRADTGAPVAGAVVGGEWGDAVTTGADGRYSFPSVPLDGATGSRTWGVQVVPPVGSHLGAVTGTVTVTAGQAATYDAALPAPPANARPVADPQVVTIPEGQDRIQVTVTGSDADRDPLIYRVLLTNTSKFQAYLVTEGQPVVQVYLALGEREGRFQFVTTDGKLDSTPAEVVVRRPTTANAPPTASIAPFADIDEGASVTFDGTGSTDTDGTIASYAWDLDGDGAYDDSTSPTPSRTYPDNATVTIGLRVTDDRGATATTSRTLRVRNVAPSVAAGADVTLDASGHLVRAGTFTDPGADTWTGTVDWGDGAGAQPLALTGKGFTLDHTLAPGTRSVTVQVCDDDGQCGTGSLTVTVPSPPPENRPPVASITGPASVVEGSSARLDASASTDPDGSVVAWEWDLDGDGAFDDATGTVVDVPTTDDGSITVAVRVRDDKGATASASHTATVVNAPPVVDAGADQAAEKGKPAHRAGSFTDPGNDTWTATVDWGEGAGPVPLSLTGQTFDLVHSFASVGTFMVVVRVCDDDRGCGSDGYVVTVTDPPPTPTADLTVVKSHDGELVAGGTVAYHLAVTNAGPDPAAGVTVTDALPAGLSYISGSGAGWSCSLNGQEVTCSRSSDLPVGAAPVLTVRAALVPPSAPGARVTNHAAVSATTPDPDALDNSSDDTGTVTAAPGSADLSVALSGPASIRSGERATWTATVRNGGPDDAGQVMVAVVVPATISGPGVTGDGWTCDGSAPVRCRRSGLAAGRSATLAVVGTAAISGRAAATTDPPALEATVSGSVRDPDDSDNRAVLAVDVTPGQGSSSTSSTSTSTSSTSTSTIPASTRGSSGSTSSTRGATTSTGGNRAASGSQVGPGATSGGPYSSPAPGGTASTAAAAGGGSTAASSATGSLPATGSSPWFPTLLGCGLIALGSTLVIARRRRRTGTG